MLVNVKSANIYLFVDISHNDCLSNKFYKCNTKLYLVLTFTRLVQLRNLISYHRGEITSCCDIFIVLQNISKLLLVVRRRKKSCLFPLTRPTLIFHADPKVFFSAQFQKRKS